MGFIRRCFFAFKCFFKIWFHRELAEKVRAAISSDAQAAPALPRRLSGEAERGAARLLAVLQREGRLVDFLQEDISACDDAQVGAAVRAVHAGCGRALAEFVAFAPVMEGEEGGRVRVEPGFDASAIRLVGDVRGDPPFSGSLTHHGWRAETIALPELPESMDAMIVAPAEVEV